MRCWGYCSADRISLPKAFREQVKNCDPCEITDIFQTETFQLVRDDSYTNNETWKEPLCKQNIRSNCLASLKRLVLSQLKPKAEVEEFQDLQALAIELPWPGWLGVLRAVILTHLDISRMREAVLSNVCRTQAEKFCSDNSRENVKDRLGI